MINPLPLATTSAPAALEPIAIEPAAAMAAADPVALAAGSIPVAPPADAPGPKTNSPAADTNAPVASFPGSEMVARALLARAPLWGAQRCAARPRGERNHIHTISEPGEFAPSENSEKIKVPYITSNTIQITTEPGNEANVTAPDTNSPAADNLPAAVTNARAAITPITISSDSNLLSQSAIPVANAAVPTYKRLKKSRPAMREVKIDGHLYKIPLLLRKPSIMFATWRLPV
ncbi:hypothetical protein DFP73DRAFT_611241 [Morchella snyderi]|nr:hypothetical protein DFP73DRAFT_611241 [Morchella snyderi]